MISDKDIKDFVNFKIRNLIESGKIHDKKAVMDCYFELCHSVGADRLMKFIIEDLNSKFGKDFISVIDSLMKDGLTINSKASEETDLNPICTGKQFFEHFKKSDDLSEVRECLSCDDLDSCDKRDAKKIHELQEDLLYCKEHPDVKVVLCTHKNYSDICMEYFQKHISEDSMWYNRAMNSPHAILKGETL